MNAAKTKYTDLLPRILAALPEDEEHAIFQRDLMKILNVSSDTVKRAIRYGRQQGYKIISCRRGYFLTENEVILKRFLHTMTKQAITRFGSTSKLRKAVDRGSIEGQMTIEEMSGEGTK